MTANHPSLGLQGVLDEFMMEDDHGSEVLARYVREYPQFALQLIDFSILAANEDVDGPERPLRDRPCRELMRPG